MINYTSIWGRQYIFRKIHSFGGWAFCVLEAWWIIFDYYLSSASVLCWVVHSFYDFNSWSLLAIRFMSSFPVSSPSYYSFFFLSISSYCLKSSSMRLVSSCNSSVTESNPFSQLFTFSGVEIVHALVAVFSEDFYYAALGPSFIVSWLF